MIWATVSSWSCFCWLYRASPSLAAKNIINLISVLAIWWCPCVESSLVLLKRVFAMTSAFSWQNSVIFCPSSFCTPRPNLPVTPGISWLPILHSSPLKWKEHLFWVLILEDLVGLHRTIELQLFSIGEWNAEVGSQEIPEVTGMFGLGIQNEAGQKLTEFCQENALVIANNLFQQHKRWLYPWTPPDGQYWNHIDYILCTEYGEAPYSEQKKD